MWGGGVENPNALKKKRENKEEGLVSPEKGGGVKRKSEPQDGAKVKMGQTLRDGRVWET